MRRPNRGDPGPVTSGNLRVGVESAFERGLTSSNAPNGVWCRRMRSRPIVVLAEDDEDTRRVYGLILRHFGYRVAEAASGLEAVHVTREVQPSLVLMDIGLPGVDGWEA